MARRLDVLPGCDVARSRNRDAILLVTDTGDLAEDEDLRRRIEGIDEIEALVLTFGQIAPGEASARASDGRNQERQLPVVGAQSHRGRPDNGPAP